MPIIQYILELGHDVLFAGNQQQRDYITTTFPNIATVHLEGYNVYYSTTASRFMLTIAKQVPSILHTILKEHDWLQKIVVEHKIDAIISDNRYGLYHRTIPCAIMTHQLQVLTGMGKVIDNLVRVVHKLTLSKFNNCWVVDTGDANALSGLLSQPQNIPKNAVYLGLLSQLRNTKSTQKRYILFLLSGPEPQRTILSDILWQHAKNFSQPIVFVEGSNDIQERTNIPQHISYHKQLATQELSDVLGGANLVICRSGYSTIMDLVCLNKRAVLVPTPGQTEQEYLGKILHEQKIFTTISQNNFDLSSAVELSTTQLNKTFLAKHFSKYKEVIDNWLK